MIVPVSADEDIEFKAIQAIYAALKPLDSDARARVINYAIGRLEIKGTTLAPVQKAEVGSSGEEDHKSPEPSSTLPKYGSFAELFDAAHPKTNAEKALVAGYWLQVCQGAESFDGQSANKELKNLGEGLVNITNAIDGLKEQKPALALQLKKSGTSQQARKTYKITVAGIKAVETMVNE